MVRLRSLAQASVTRVDGVGDKTAQNLEEVVGISSVFDLLQHYPRRYLDRTKQAHIRDLRPGVEAWCWPGSKRVELPSQPARSVDGRDRRHRRQRPPPAARSSTRGGGPASCRLAPRRPSSARSRSTRDGGRCRIPVSTSSAIPTPASCRSIPSPRRLSSTACNYERWIRAALARVDELDGLVDPLPEHWRDRARHDRPQPGHAPDPWARGVGRRSRRPRTRLAFDELLRLQLILVMRKRAIERESKGIRHQVDGELVHRFEASLPVRTHCVAAQGHRRDRHPTWPVRTRCTGCCRATSERARPWSPSPRC